MTIILTGLVGDHIVQVSDRRLTWPDGKLYDDDTNKAVFFCGRVAVAFTGLYQMEGKPAAEWIGSCMKDHTQIEAAMKQVGDRADRYLRQSTFIDKRLTVVATGWATLRGAFPIQPFVCVASNCMTDSWDPAPYGPMNVRTVFPGSSWNFFSAGQSLYHAEKVRLNRLVKRALEHGATAMSVARLLQSTVFSVAVRNTRVGKGMIVQMISQKAVLEARSLIVTPLTLNAQSFSYFSSEGIIDPFQAPVVACNGTLLTNLRGGTIRTGEKGMIRTEMEMSARKYPIRLSPDQTKYSSECPFCAETIRRGGSDASHHVVEGELPLMNGEAWIFCRGTTGHLLLIQRVEN